LNNDKKQKLIDLGAERLAQALLEIAVLNDAADDLVEHLIATPKENVQRFKKKLAGLKRSKRFIDWQGASWFARDITMLLQDLKSGVSDQFTGVEMVAAFYETDENIFERCDDSGGDVGDVFRHDSKEVFVEDALRCANKPKVADIILNLNRKNDYFEKTRIASWGKLSTAAFIDIARVYLESGDVKTAHLWLNKIPEDETFQAYERDQLLLDIFRQQGDSEKLTDLLHRKFRSHRSMDTLQALLDVIGQAKQDSEKFDAEAVNWELMKYLRWSRDRYKTWEGTE